MINLTIDGINVSVSKGSTILQAAREVGIYLPTLCWHPDQGLKPTAVFAFAKSRVTDSCRPVVLHRLLKAW